MLTKDERAGLEKKLETCSDPSTRDLVKAFAAIKQGAGYGSNAEAQKKHRKERSWEKSWMEGEELFGPGDLPLPRLDVPAPSDTFPLGDQVGPYSCSSLCQIL